MSDFRGSEGDAVELGGGVFFREVDDSAADAAARIKDGLGAVAKVEEAAYVDVHVVHRLFRTVDAGVVVAEVPAEGEVVACAFDLAGVAPEVVVDGSEVSFVLVLHSCWSWEPVGVYIRFANKSESDRRKHVDGPVVCPLGGWCSTVGMGCISEPRGLPAIIHSFDIFLYSVTLYKAGTMMKAGRVNFVVYLLTILCLAVPLSSPVMSTAVHQGSRTGMTLYVGGSGPGNYTKIQDAVNHASDGDTVFVYDDSSPYHEAVTVDRSISLIGENEETTVLDGSGLAKDILMVTDTQVVIHGFTLENSGSNGLVLSQDNAVVSQMTIKDCADYGVYLYKTGTTPVNKCTLHNNIIADTSIGIFGISCNQSLITKNTFTGNHNAVTMSNSFFNNFSFNVLEGNVYGIIDTFSGQNHYYFNRIANCTTGLEIIASGRDYVEKNDFLNNGRHAIFEKYPSVEVFSKLNALRNNNTYFVKYYHILGRTTWQGNYWNASRTRPYPIYGRSGVLPALNRVEFDWRPAKQPNGVSLVISTKVNDISPYRQISLPLTVTVAGSADLSNVSLYYRFGTANFSTYLSSIQESGFGFTNLNYPDTVDVVDGTAYAASRLNNRIVAYDVTDPTNLKSLWYTQDTTYLSQVNDIKVTDDQQFCYTISLNKRWVCMWDISSGSAAVRVAQYLINDNTGMGMYLAISEDDNYLYATSYHYFLMFNITNKAQHQLSMVYSDHIGDSPNVLWKPTVYKDTVYAPDGTSSVQASGLYVYDVTNKAAPKRVNIINQSTTCSAACQVYTHSNGFTYLFLGGRSQITPYSIGILNIYNISAGNATFPVFMYKIRVLDNDTGGRGGNATSGWGVFLHDYLFMGINNWNHTKNPDWQTGFWVWNFTNIEAPSVVARLYGAGSPHYLNYVHYLDLDRNGTDRSVYLAIQDDDCIITVDPGWAEASGGWVKYGTAGKSPWSFAFDFPNGTGYYEFYSIGQKVGSDDEQAPLVHDAMCRYTAPQDAGTKS